MAEAVRPGGWLLLEEADYGFSTLTAEVADSSYSVFVSTFQALFGFLREKGILDPYFGRKVRRLMEQLGYTDIVQEGWSRIVQGGEPYTRFTTITLQAAAKPMIVAGLLTQEQYETVQRSLMNPSFSYPGPTVFSAWGRRPL